MAPGSALGYPAPGARIGRFRILEQLGQGGMGVVFRAMEENLGREVALKVIAPLYAHDLEFRERFTREARAQASLESAHVVAVYAHGEEDGYLYIASQLVGDGDLGELISSAGVPPMVNALEVIEQTASGLADAHAAGLVHRDIKPGNVLVRLKGGTVRAYLCDFGIARKVDAAATRFSSSAVGTPAYMAPELHGGASASAATDIYSLGCLLWVALTGTMPYRATTEYQLIAAHLQQPVPQLPETSPMARAANRILRTAMAKSPDDRYRSATAMRADLQAALRLPATPVAAAPEQSGPTAVRPRVTGPGNRPTGSGSDRPHTVAPSAWAPAAWRPSGGSGSGSAGLGGPSGPGGPSRPSGPAAGATPSGGTPPHPPAYAVRPASIPEPPAWATTPPPRRTGRWWAVGAAAAVTAMGVGIGAALISTGDGDDGQARVEPSASAFADGDPKGILDAAEGQMAVLDNARVTGQFQSEDEGIIQIDLITTSIGDCQGTMTLTGGGVAEIRSVDGQIYIRPDGAYWDALLNDDATSSTVQNALDGRWVHWQGLRNSLRPVCDLDRFFERDGREDATAETQGVEEVAGQDAVKVIQYENDQSETVYVAVDEPHYMLRLEESGVDVFDFSDFDAEIDIVAPVRNDYVEYDDLVEGKLN